ncbi:MAG: MarR family transcriptional regulator [Actinomycetota bacterium]|nr:MarR family transcriptional regulator [Actinomycetota bacterium]HZY66261.1 MarR family transcriptional regulator [Rubrobacteraceae bacterium]
MDAVGRETGRQHPIRTRTGFALAKVCRAHRGNVGDLLAEIGLHVGQEMVLIELWERDGLRGGELATRLGVEPPTVTKMLRRLENCGLVERRQDPEDARSFRVFLTEEGRSLEKPVTRCWERVEEKTLAGLSPEERRAFHGLLAKVRANLDPGFEPE